MTATETRLSIADDPVHYRPNWWDQAACLGTGVEMWCLPLPKASLRSLRETYCAHCPVAGHCLQDGVNSTHLQNTYGTVRLGLPPCAWKKLPAVILRWNPTNDSDWAGLAAWILDEGWRSVVKAARTRCRRAIFRTSSPLWDSERREAVCDQCGATYTPRRKEQRFCCREHRMAWASGHQ
jgi:hypothetical protein